MGDLTTYSLSDFVPFLREVYLRHFAILNDYVWPAQFAAVALGGAALVYAWRGRGRWVGAALAICWGWVGWAYQMQTYATYNWAGTYFGWAFVAQGALLLAIGLLGGLDRETEQRLDAPGWIGCGLGAFGIAGFPFLIPLLGRSWSTVEIFGIAPDPTVVATLGLALTGERTYGWLFVVPLLWCFVTGATSWVLGATTGLITAGAGVVALAAALWRMFR